MFAQTPPTILVQPQSYAVVAGSNLTVSVTFTGAPEPGLQWQFNGTNLPGANLSTLTLNNMTVAQSGSYAVVVTNSFGSVTSAMARLAAFVPTKTWTGSGDGVSWGDKNNWSGETVPTSSDSIFINYSTNTLAVGLTTISNMICERPLSFYYAHLTVNGAVQITNGIYLAGNNPNFSVIGITASGSNALYIDSTVTSLNSQSISWLIAQQGGIISFPALLDFNNRGSLAGGAPNCQWQASGPGSGIYMPALQSIEGPSYANSYLNITASQGGAIYAQDIQNITVYFDGSSFKGIHILATDTNSVIRMDNLSQWGGDGKLSSSYMEVANGGQIVVTNLQSTVGVSLYAVGGTSFKFPSLKTFENGYFATQGAIQASGSNSLIYMPALQTITGPQEGYSSFAIQALNGAQINMPNATTIYGSTWNGSTSGTAIISDGVGSIINLTNLTFFADHNLTASSYLRQQNGGIILLRSNYSFSVSVQLAPAFMSAPQSIFTVGSDLTVTYSIAVSASSPAYYQWHSNSIPIPDGTNCTLVLNHAQPDWSGSGYSVVVSNAIGSATSVVAILTIPTEPLYTAVSGNGQILVAPSIANYYLGQTFTLTAVPGGYSAFAGWSDANPNNPRTIVINTNNVYTALFTNTVPPVNIAQAGGQLVVFYPNFGTNYRLMTTTNLATGPWVPATNGVPVTAFTFTNTSPAQFFQLQ